MTQRYNMQIGDTVVDIKSVGVIVGVSTSGNPIVEWDLIGEKMFEEAAVEDLIQINLPQPTEELDPSKEEDDAGE
jgi:hypothetical protein